jgi:CubicO group peptidase (beta-lactamase class C family)
MEAELKRGWFARGVMSWIARRQVIAGSTAAVLASCVGRLRAATKDWTEIDPAVAGFAPGLVGKLDQFVLTGQALNVHSVIVVRRGRMVAERYYEGEDQVRVNGGRTRLEHVSFTAERSHELRSVTKSIVGLLYGIALGEGKVPALDQSLLAQFPQYNDLPDMAQRRRWTIAQAITMTLGTDWDEEVSYDDPRNGQTAMEAAPDRYRYVLEQPIVAVAGERWIYSGGATALIGKVLENGIGRSVHDFACEVMFDPLGIGPTEWRRGGRRRNEFRLRPRDAAARSCPCRPDDARRRQDRRTPDRPVIVARRGIHACGENPRSARIRLSLVSWRNCIQRFGRSTPRALDRRDGQRRPETVCLSAS